MRRLIIAFVSLCLMMNATVAEAHLLSVSPLRPTNQHSIKKRESIREHIQEKLRFERRTREAGHAATSTFHKSLPSWYTSRLLKYRGMVLSAPALIAYYNACEKVGHYIGGAGYRSHAVQASMTSSLAAPAGYSYHEVGLALDVFGVSARERRALIAAGFNQLAGEPWHYSYIVYG